MKITKQRGRSNEKDIIEDLRNIQDVENFIKKYDIFKIFLKIPEHLTDKLIVLINTIESATFKKAIQLIKQQFYSKTSANIQFWIDRGYTGDEVKERYRKRQALGSIIKKNNPQYNDINPTQIKYWIKKGYSEVEAKEKVSERQRTFTLEKCIKKYGIELGTERFNERQNKWIESLISNKTPEELLLFNKSKGKSKQELILKYGIENTEEISYKRGSYNRKSLLIVQYGEKKAEEILKQRFIHLKGNWRGRQASKISKEFGEDLQKITNEEVISEFCISKERGFYLYDFKIGNKLIEFNGDFWHCNPLYYPDIFFNEKVEQLAFEIWEKDKQKVDFAIDKGYAVLTIWENEYKTNKINVIKRVQEFLNDKS